MPGICTPWLAVGDLTLCTATDFIDGRLAKALTAAQELMFNATCQQFPGVCDDVVRPDSTSGGRWPWGAAFPVLADGSRWIPFGLDSLPGIIGALGCGCGGIEVCACTIHSAVTLPGTPVIEVTEIKVDGDVVDPSRYALLDNRTVIRVDGEFFPCCQNVGLPDTDDPTFSIAYKWGAAAPESVLLGTEVLACELATGWANGGECRLPRRLTSMVYEGVSVAVLDPMQFLDEGKFGLYEPDAAVAQFGCDSGGHTPGKLLTPADWQQTRHSQ